MITSSIQTRLVSHLHLVRLMSSARWYVAGAFVSPKGIRMHWYVPTWQTNEVFWWSWERLRLSNIHYRHLRLWILWLLAVNQYILPFYARGKSPWSSSCLFYGSQHIIWVVYLSSVRRGREHPIWSQRVRGLRLWVAYRFWTVLVRWVSDLLGRVHIWK